MEQVIKGAGFGVPDLGGGKETSKAKLDTLKKEGLQETLEGRKHLYERLLKRMYKPS